MGRAERYIEMIEQAGETVCVCERDACNFFRILIVHIVQHSAAAFGLSVSRSRSPKRRDRTSNAWHATALSA